MKFFLNIALISVMILCTTISTHLAGEPEISSNGLFIQNTGTDDWVASSPDLKYTCRYEVEAVSDERRQLTNFRFYEEKKLLFSMEKDVPGDDFYISNSGYIAFIDLSKHFNFETTIHCYDKNGQHLFSKIVTGGSFFQFSPDGNRFGLAADNQIIVITLPEGTMEHYPNGYQFTFSEDGKSIAIAKKNQVLIYENQTEKIITANILRPRKVLLSKSLGILSIIDKRNLKTWSLSTGKLVFHEKVGGNIRFRDLQSDNKFIYAGLHQKSEEKSTGIIIKFDPSGKKLLKKIDTERKMPRIPESSSSPVNYWQGDSIPWPFVPFDSMPEIWNHYEQHMGGYGSSYSYLHQGLDIITPIAEPTYAVETGVVKCVLTIGGASYWRVAISPSESPGYSDGWLYAHLIESSIQVAVGDTVQIHDYLGDIIQWSGNWGHIHFVQIKDSGLVWQYNDNEWGINFNPLMVLKSDPDTIPPVIENAFPNSKFAFCTNETSQYLDADSLYGDVDIIVKVNDYCGFSLWTQPAFSLYYQVKSLATGNIVFPRTLAQVLNHTYPFYSGGNYEPYATLLYKRDDTLYPSSWMDMNRNYHHILTNNNGDSLAELSEKSLALNTAAYNDGWYRIIVEAFDDYGNSASDSMDVQFRNGITSLPTVSGQPRQFTLEQNYPNPFNPETVISWQLAVGSDVQLTVFNVMGQKVQVLVNENQLAGDHSIRFNGSGLPSGIYYYRLQAGEFLEIRKMILVK